MCTECAEVCRNAFAQGIDDPDFCTLVRSVVLARDCSFFCDTAAFLMKNGSEFTEEFALFCAKACQKCAEECSKQAKPWLQSCIDSCTRCATMLNAVGRRLTNN